MTNYDGQVVILTRTEQDYEVLYSGEIQGAFDREFFDAGILEKENFYAGYQYGVDGRLAICEKDGKVARVQNSLVALGQSSVRNADFVCAVIDKSGVGGLFIWENSEADGKQ